MYREGAGSKNRPSEGRYLKCGAAVKENAPVPDMSQLMREHAF